MNEDGFWRPHVRAQFVTGDGAVILMRYTGLVEQTAAFKKAAEQDQSTDWDDQYMRLSIEFATNHSKYRWLEQSLFVAAGRLLGTGKIEYALYRIDLVAKRSLEMSALGQKQTFAVHPIKHQFFFMGFRLAQSTRSPARVRPALEGRRGSAGKSKVSPSFTSASSLPNASTMFVL